MADGDNAIIFSVRSQLQPMLAAVEHYGIGSTPVRPTDACGGREESALPADVVVGLELAPENDPRLGRGADRLHDRLDLALLLLEELLEALLVGPLVHDHHLAVGSVEAVRDEAVLLGAAGDALHLVGVLLRVLLELRGVALRPEGHDHGHAAPPRSGFVA